MSGGREEMVEARGGFCKCQKGTGEVCSLTHASVLHLWTSHYILSNISQTGDTNMNNIQSRPP